MACIKKTISQVVTYLIDSYMLRCFTLKDRKVVIMPNYTNLKSIGYTKLEIPHTAGQFSDTHCTAVYIF